MTQFTYYANRRGFQEIDAEGDTQTFSYNVFRNRTAFTNEDGQTTYYDYDSSGDVIQQLNPDGTTLAYTWLNGLKTSDTDEYGQTTTYHYDSNGNLLDTTDPLENVVYSNYAPSAMRQPTRILLQTTKLERPATLGDTVAMFGDSCLQLIGRERGG